MKTSLKGENSIAQNKQKSNGGSFDLDNNQMSNEETVNIEEEVINFFIKKIFKPD